MKKYIYIDNSEYPKANKIFECEANGILEADSKYEQATGSNPVKQPYIGCQCVESNQ